MLTSIALLLLFGSFVGAIFKKLHLPYIIGMLLVGIVFGPYALNLFDARLLAISPDLRQIALIIILVNAGLSLEIEDLKRVGRPAILMCFLPATFEIIAFILFAPALLGVTLLEAAILGAVMGAVSPAIIVPRMTKMIDEGWGTKQGIPQMIIAGSSADDVYVIVIFSALLSFSNGGTVAAVDFLQIPISIILGILVGVFAGIVLTVLFKAVHMRDSMKVIIILAVSFLFLALETALEGIVGVSGLLAVMSMCIMINHRSSIVAPRLSSKFSKLWVAAEIFLFVLVGATVNIKYALSAGIMMLVMLFIGLAFRLAGSYLAVLGTGLNQKEKVFCMLSQIPKATVQAAIGGVPLAMGLACGNTVLSFAVISILISAPIGAFAIDASYRKYLQKEQKD